MPDDNTMTCDVLIIGAGPAGLSAAIKVKQLASKAGKPLQVCVLEKGAHVGAHILSGAVFEPRALNELIPDWSLKGAPLNTAVNHDDFLWLTKTKAWSLPVPRTLRHHHHFIISLGKLCRWLATQAEQLGVEIYSGFAGSALLFDADNALIGVQTGDVGLDKNGKPTPQYQKGMKLYAKQTLLAEGCRGSLTQTAIKHFNLDANSQPQTYAIGLKELWELDPAQHKLGHVMHSIGWPMDNKTYGGAFAYHLENYQLSLGLVIGLDYQNPTLQPYAELQRLKTHPSIAPLLQGGRRITYGARALNEGGYQAIPKLTFPGGMLVGCSAGFLNVAKIKGSHTAMKSGMLAAEAIAEHLLAESASSQTSASIELVSYPKKIKASWIWPELYTARNLRPSFRAGLWLGMAYCALDTYILRGHAPWTFKHHLDYKQLKPANQCKQIDYPAPNGTTTFDLMTSVSFSHTFHEENQPAHLKLGDPTRAINLNLRQYDAPERYYCPAGVYEIVQDDQNQAQLQINAQNCIHCKTCDIKDPSQNITWAPPEGGGGPNYPDM